MPRRRAHEGHVHPGTNHGFLDDTTPRYDEAASKLAWFDRFRRA